MLYVLDASAYAGGKKYDFRVTQETMGRALDEIVHLTGHQLLYPYDLAKETANPVIGRYTLKKALRVLLKGSNFSGGLSKRGVMVISRKKPNRERRMLTSKLKGALLASASAAMVGSGSAAIAYDEDKVEDDFEEIVITGSYTVQSMNGATGLNMSLKETPQSVSIMTVQQIQDFALNDMAAVMDHIPGVSMIGDASEDNLIYVRGFVADTAIQVDGMITTTANSAYSASTSQGLDPVIAERVEVLKGAAGILSGLGEPAATINMIRKRPKEEFGGYLFASGGSWNNYRVEGDVTGGLNDSGTIRGRLVGSYQDTESFLDRYGRKKSVIYGIVEANITSATVLSLAADHLKSDSTGVYNWNSNALFYTDGTTIDAPRSKNTGQDWSYRDVRITSLMPEITHEFDNGWFVKVAYRYEKSKIDVLNGTLGDYVDRNTGDYVSAPWAAGLELLSDRDLKTHSFNAYATGTLSLFGREHDLVFGYNYGKNKFLMENTESQFRQFNYFEDDVIPAPDFSNPGYEYKETVIQSQSGFYGTLRLNPVDDLKVMIGGRLSTFNYDYTNRSDATSLEMYEQDEKNIFTPYAGVVYDLTEFSSVYTSYTGIFKPNGEYDRNGDPLAATKGFNIEAGIKLAFYDDKLNLSAAIYQAHKDNVPTWTGEGQLPNGFYIYENVDGVKTKGFEIEISGALTENWNIFGGYTYNKANDEDGNKRDTWVPSNVFKLTTTYDLKDHIEGLTVGLSTRWQSRAFYSDFLYVTYDDLVPFTQENDAYFIFDAMASYDITENISLNVNLNNIFDVTYSRSIWGYADYGQPRNFSASARWSF